MEFTGTDKDTKKKGYFGFIQYMSVSVESESSLTWYHERCKSITDEKLKLSQDILFFLSCSYFETHYSSNHACTHTHAFTLKCRFHDWLSLCRWRLISLFSVPHLSIKFCFLSPFYLEDPPWVSALTPDERHFISELLTQFHRVCFLFEGKIQNNPFQCIFYK